MSECENCAFPSIGKQVKNLAFSFTNVVSEAFKTGKVIASKELIQTRMAKCNSCEFRYSDRCSECGCVLAYKVGLQAEKCPRGKW